MMSDTSNPNLPPASPTSPETTAQTEPATPATRDAALDALAATGVTPEAVAAASNTASAPADPLETGVQSLEYRLARAEAQIEALVADVASALAFAEAAKAHFGGKL